MPRSLTLKERMAEAEVLGYIGQARKSVESLPQDISTAGRNVAATFLGAPSDLMQMGVDFSIWRDKVLGNLPPDAEFMVPFTSDILAEQFGGSTEHRSFMPAQFLTPGPGEFIGAAKAGFGAAIAIKNLGKEKLAKQVEKRLASGEDPVQVLNETGIYKDSSGNTRYWISDLQTTVDWDKARKLADTIVEKGHTGPHGRPVTFMLQDIVSNKELFEAYPSLRNAEITMPFSRNKKGEVIELSAPQAEVGDRAAAFPSLNAIDVYDVSNLNSTRGSVLHEIQHLIDTVEGFSNGANPDIWVSRINDLQDANISRGLIKAFETGVLDAKVVKDLTNLGDLAQLRKMNPEKHKETMAVLHALSEVDPKLMPLDKAVAMLKEARLYAKHFADGDEFEIEMARQIADTAKVSAESGVRAMLQTLADAKMIDPKTVDLATNIPTQDLRELAFTRYLINEGEVRARMADVLRNIDPAVSQRVPKETQFLRDTMKNKEALPVADEPVQ